MGKKIEYSANIRVRYAEIDGMGIVYNGNYLTYFEVGRVEFLRHYNMVYADLEKAGYHLPLIESHLEYKKPAYYDDELEIRTSTDFNGGIKFKIFYEIWRDKDLLTTGYTTHIFLSIKTNKPVRPPKIFMDAWNKAKEIVGKN